MLLYILLKMLYLKPDPLKSDKIFESLFQTTKNKNMEFFFEKNKNKNVSFYYASFFRFQKLKFKINLTSIFKFIDFILFLNNFKKEQKHKTKRYF